MNQASRQSCEVPVLPATSHSGDLRGAACALNDDAGEHACHGAGEVFIIDAGLFDFRAGVEHFARGSCGFPE